MELKLMDIFNKRFITFQIMNETLLLKHFRYYIINAKFCRWHPYNQS